MTACAYAVAADASTLAGSSVLAGSSTASVGAAGVSGFQSAPIRSHLVLSSYSPVVASLAGSAAAGSAGVSPRWGVNKVVLGSDDVTYQPGQELAQQQLVPRHL
jgi:hypothetical protein